MDVTLRQLRAFAAVARAGSFTGAAESLHVTQSALSGLIKGLESELDVCLVNRSTRYIELSEIGKEFHGVVIRLLRELDDALDHVDDLKRLRSGVVRIAVPQLMASTLMPEIFARFSREHPDVEIHLTDCAVEDIIDIVVSGRVDIGIGPQRSRSEKLYSEPFIAPPFISVFPRDHALASFDQVRWQDLTRYPLIALQGQFTAQLDRDLFGASESRTIEVRQEVAYMSTALSLVHAGMGVSICLPYAQPLVDLYHLETRPLVEPEVRRRFFIYRRQYATLSPAAEAFTQVLHAYAADHEEQDS